MKRITISLISLFICLSAYSLTDKVCIYPYNEEISKYIEQYLSVKCRKAGVDFSVESVISGDQRLLEYICITSDSELLIVSDCSELSGFNCYRVWVFDSVSKSFDLVYECITQNDGMGKEVLKAIEPYITGDVTYTEEQPVEEKTEKETAYNLTITSNVPALVYFEGKEIGQTPVTIDEYTVPSLVRLKAEGYTDYYCLIDEAEDEISVTMKSSEYDLKESYMSARNNFYGSFGTMLLSFGIKAALPVFFDSGTKANTIADYVSDGIIGVFGVNAAIALVQYYKTAKQVSP